MPPSDPRIDRRALSGALAIFYVGVLVGVSFIATPAKFLVDELTTPELLLVGRATFGVFGWIELVCVGAVFAAVWPRPASIAIAGATLLLVVWQIAVLRPQLDARVSMMAEGVELAPSIGHSIYGAIELVKLLAMAGVGTLELTHSRTQASSANRSASASAASACGSSRSV